jgi:hypothetical protein
MTCPRCKCPECAKVELNAVLSRRVARETNDSSELRAAYALQPHARRFLLPREPGKPPVDPDAEQLRTGT